MEDDQIPVQEVSVWQPMTDKVDLAVLGKLGEEVGELISAKERCLIQGIDEVSPDTGKVNRKWLEDEVADVQAMLFHVVLQFGLDMPRIAERRRRKYEYKAKWFAKLKAERASQMQQGSK